MTSTYFPQSAGAACITGSNDLNDGYIGAVDPWVDWK
jgi:hypothetical protein